MPNFLIRIGVRTVFATTSRERAIQQAENWLERYLSLADDLSSEMGSRVVEVPLMRGVDEDMRRWSFYMTLEHNTIVNRSISALVQQLSRGEVLSGAAVKDPKTDVLPGQMAGEEQVAAFKHSVREHIEALQGLGKLRGTKTAPHPIFGDFDAHQWHCMFSFHLGLHYKQAVMVADAAKAL